MRAVSFFDAVVHLGERRQRREDCARFREAAGGDQQPCAIDLDFLAVRIELACPVEQSQRGIDVVVVAVGCQCLQPQLVRGRGDDACDELAHRALRQCAREFIDYFAGDERFDIGNTAYTVAGRELRVLVRVDFREHEAAVVFGCELFQHRTQCATRSAPRRPEVDDHRRVARGLNHRRVEIGLVYIDRVHQVTSGYSRIGKEVTERESCFSHPFIAERGLQSSGVPANETFRYQSVFASKCTRLEQNGPGPSRRRAPPPSDSARQLRGHTNVRGRREAKQSIAFGLRQTRQSADERVERLARDAFCRA